eukprot:TRINITY_DN2682_c0_g1_i1.p1 TRINITY_DN2682_c0_g1~~TRINITY_DN2682_c0_g1_i1.p1  ORF type:complete len:122 (+),score=28.40 TRINITY_DN2682_c0_g1_i1:94-459(+)
MCIRDRVSTQSTGNELLLVMVATRTAMLILLIVGFVCAENHLPNEDAQAIVPELSEDQGLMDRSDENLEQSYDSKPRELSDDEMTQEDSSNDEDEQPNQEDFVEEKWWNMHDLRRRVHRHP